MGMGDKNSKSADVSETDEEAEILNIARISRSDFGVAAASKRPGVVCSIYWSEDKGDTIIEVGLDRSRWREIPPGSDEKQPVVDHTAIPDCVVCGGRTAPHRDGLARFCTECGETLVG